MATSKHQHKFVIPVEWRYKFMNSDGSLSQATVNHPWSYRKVTKLMCECGEEKNR